jgi:hypothetical protein
LSFCEGVGVLKIEKSESEVLKIEKSESEVLKIEKWESEVLKIEKSESEVLKIEKSESEVLKIEKSESELLCTDCTALATTHVTHCQPVKKFPLFYGIRRFIAMFTTAGHLCLL